MNAFGAAMGLPILSIYPPKQTPFVAVEFDTFQNVDWDPLNITLVTHVGISINSLKSNVTEWVTVGVSAATGDCLEKHIVKSWSFDSSL